MLRVSSAMRQRRRAIALHRAAGGSRSSRPFSTDAAASSPPPPPSDATAVPTSFGGRPLTLVESMAVARAAAQSLGVPAPPRPLPIGTKIVKTHAPPPPPPSLSPAEEKALRLSKRESPLALLSRLQSEYILSVREKLADPVGVWKRAYLSTLQGFARRWKHRFLVLTRLQPRPSILQVESFNAETNLADFTLLNDNAFGGSSSCALELRERLEPDATTGEITKRYSVVFKGELKMMAPFQGRKDQLLESGKRGKTTQPHRPLSNTPPQQDQSTSAAAAAPSPSASSTAFPSAPGPMRMSSRPPSFSSSSPSSFPPLPSPPAASAAVPAADASSIPPPPPPQPSAEGGPANPFLRVNESSQQTFLKLQQEAEQQDQQPQSNNSAPPLVSADGSIVQAPSLSARFAQAVSRIRGDRNDREPINGFAAVILPAFQYPDLNLEFFDFVSMQVRTDGRSYIFNLRARDGFFAEMAGLVWQARIKAETPRPMHKLEVRFENLICTEQGRPRQFGTALPKSRVESFGFSVTGPPGPFELELEGMWAHTGTPDFERKALEAHRAAEAAEKARRLARKVADFDKRRAVSIELEKLRRARLEAAAAQGGSTANFDKQIMSELQRKETQERQAAAAATTAAAATQAAESASAAAAASAAASSPASATPASPASVPPPRFGERPRSEQLREMEEEVELELQDERRARTSKPFGFGGGGAATAEEDATKNKK